MEAARIPRPYRVPVSGAHMIYGGRRYPTLIFLGSPRIECKMPIAPLTSLHPDLISRPSSASSNSDSDFDSRAVDSSIVSIVAFGIHCYIEWTTDSGIDSRAVDSRAVDSGIDSRAIDSRIDCRVHCKLRCGP